MPPRAFIRSGAKKMALGPGLPRRASGRGRHTAQLGRALRRRHAGAGDAHRPRRSCKNASRGAYARTRCHVRRRTCPRLNPRSASPRCIAASPRRGGWRASSWWSRRNWSWDSSRGAGRGPRAPRMPDQGLSEPRNRRRCPRRTRRGGSILTDTYDATDPYMLTVGGLYYLYTSEGTTFLNVPLLDRDETGPLGHPSSMRCRPCPAWAARWAHVGSRCAEGGRGDGRSTSPRCSRASSPNTHCIGSAFARSRCRAVRGDRPSVHLPAGAPRLHRRPGLRRSGRPPGHDVEVRGQRQSVRARARPGRRHRDLRPEPERQRPDPARDAGQDPLARPSRGSPPSSKRPT